MKTKFTVAAHKAVISEVARKSFEAGIWPMNFQFMERFYSAPAGSPPTHLVDVDELRQDTFGVTEAETYPPTQVACVLTECLKIY